MSNEHPITPPPELMEQWSDIWHEAKVKHVSRIEFVATQAARWGADAELEACCEVLGERDYVGSGVCGAYLRSARRPEPPSLAEQAVLGAVLRVAESPDAKAIAAAALRVAADQVVPETFKPDDTFCCPPVETIVWKKLMNVRQQFLAIATELESQ